MKNIKQSKYISVSLDESCDIAKNDNLYLCVKFLHNGRIIESFLKLFELKEKTGKYIFSIVKEFLLENNLLDKVASISTDGGGNMAGIENGVQGYFLNYNANIIWTHCIAHRVALGTKDLVDKVPEIAKFNILTHTLVEWIRGSNRRVDFFKNLPENESNIIIPMPTEIRWLSNYKSMLR